MFSEKIKRQYLEKKMPYIALVIIDSFLEIKMFCYPQFSSWVPTALAKICLSHIVITFYCIKIPLY